MQSKRTTTGCCLLGALLLPVAALTSSAQTISSPTITNPSFESPSVYNSANNYYSFQYIPSAPGWTFTALSGIAANGSGFVFFAPVVNNIPDGTQCAFLQGSGGSGSSMSQTVFIPAAQNYSFSFRASQRDVSTRDNTQDQTLTVLVDGVSVGSFTPPVGWTSYNTANIWLAPGNHTLTFYNLAVPGNATALVDLVGIGPTLTYTITNGTITIDSDYATGALIIPDTINGLPVTSIGDGAFVNNGNLTSITIGTNVTSIVDNAFEYCAGLANISIPPSVTSIGDYAFYGCRYLTNVIIPPNVSSIGDYAFGLCSSLTNISIPASVTNLGTGVFAYCYMLGAITVDPANAYYSSSNGILFNKAQTVLIEYPPALGGTSYTIPASVTNIADYAFEGCSSLTTVALPNGVASIGDYAFELCANLTNVIIPASVTNLGTAVFVDCYTLGAIIVDPANTYYTSSNGVLFNKTQTVLIQYPPTLGGPSYTIPASVSSIGDYAFEGCSSLINVIIPASVTNIGLYAFSRCSVSGVYGEGNAPPANSSVFLRHFLTVTVYYMPGTTGWAAFGLATRVAIAPWPTIQFTASPTNGFAPVSVQFSSTNTDSVANPITSWNWTFGDGSAGTNQNPAHVYTNVGSFTPVLTVTNSIGLALTASNVSIAVNPSIQFTASPTNGFAPLTVQFSGPGVDNGGEEITSYNWNFGDGLHSALQSPTHVYASPGIFYPALTVTDSLGLTASNSGPAITTYAPPRFQSVARTNGNYQLTWNTANTNLTSPAGYQVQYKTNLATHAWSNLGSVLTGLDPVLTATDTNPADRQRFYRVAASLGVNVLQDTFDPTTATYISDYYGGDVSNAFVGVVANVGMGNSAALQIQCSVNNGPNGYGYLAGQWANVNVSGNTDTNLSDYFLSFDALVSGDAAHQSGGGFQLQIQEGADPNFGPPFPQGTLLTYQPYQGGADLLIPESGVWQHFSINLGGPTFQSPNGANTGFNPTGATWQIIFQMNTGDWGAEPQINSTLIIDNLALTVLTPP